MQFSKSNDDYGGADDQSSGGYISSSSEDHGIDDILSDERLSKASYSEEQNERFQACFRDHIRTSPPSKEKTRYTTGEALDAMQLFIDRITTGNFSPHFKCATRSEDLNFVTDPYMIARAIVAALRMQKNAKLTQKAGVIGSMSGADELVEIHLFEYNNLLKKSAIQGLWEAFGRENFPEFKEFENVYKAVRDLRTEALLEMTIHFLDAIVLAADDYTPILPSSTFTFGDKRMYAIVTRFTFNWCELFPKQITMNN